MVNMRVISLSLLPIGAWRLRRDVTMRTNGESRRNGCDIRKHLTILDSISAATGHAKCSTKKAVAHLHGCQSC
jgi:hypothetical protein